MTQCWLGVFTSCLMLAASVGCRLADRPPDAGAWDDDLVGAPASTPISQVPLVSQAESQPTESPPRASIASVRPIAFDVAEEIATPRLDGELPGGPPVGDQLFEVIDPPLPTLAPTLPDMADPPPYDFLDTLSPRARSLFDDGVEPYDSPSRWAVVRHLCGEDLCCGWQHLKQDYRQFYSWDSLGMLAVGIGLGAVAANTNVDYDLRDHYQGDIRGDVTNDFSRWCKFVGEGQYVIAMAATGWLAGEAMYDRPAGNVLADWGGRTLRSIFVGAPPMLIFQHAIGGPRPGESHAGSKWRPFHDNNGVSGHAFMGAAPFICAAKMCDNIPLKVGFYAVSFAPAWSRVNDDAHFTSQVFLGWWIAYWAASAVDLTNRDERSHWSVESVSFANGSGVGLVYKY